MRLLHPVLPACGTHAHHHRPQVGRRCVLDASGAEEAHCGAALWAAVTPRGDVAAAGARHGGALPAGASLEMLAQARTAGVALHAALDAHLAGARASAPPSARLS
jgi:hypothetical protein